MTHLYTRQFSGAKVSLLDDTIDCFHITDIARGLAMMNRYNGQTYRPYSVAEHSVHVASRLPPSLQMVGLLHDASEAYLIDMPKPHKIHLPDYMLYEAKLQNRIWKAFNINILLVNSYYDLVKVIDDYMLTLEGPYLLPHGELDFGPKQFNVKELLPEMNWEQSMKLFMIVYTNLSNGIYLDGPLSREKLVKLGVINE